jgi:hypothetical protein
VDESRAGQPAGRVREPAGKLQAECLATRAGDGSGERGGETLRVRRAEPVGERGGGDAGVGVKMPVRLRRGKDKPGALPMFVTCRSGSAVRRDAAPGQLMRQADRNRTDDARHQKTPGKQEQLSVDMGSVPGFPGFHSDGPLQPSPSTAGFTRAKLNPEVLVVVGRG